jgi:hypothetical protein
VRAASRAQELLHFRFAIDADGRKRVPPFGNLRVQFIVASGQIPDQNPVLHVVLALPVVVFVLARSTLNLQSEKLSLFRRESLLIGAHLILRKLKIVRVDVSAVLADPRFPDQFFAVDRPVLLPVDVDVVLDALGQVGAAVARLQTTVGARFVRITKAVVLVGGQVVGVRSAAVATDRLRFELVLLDSVLLDVGQGTALARSFVVYQEFFFGSAEFGREHGAFETVIFVS